MIVRQPNVDTQEYSDPVYPLVAIAATTIAGLFTAQRAFRIDAVELFSDTTIASSGTNFYTFNLRVGGRSCATFTINGNAITSGLAAAMTLVAESGQAPVDNRVAAKGELVDLVCTLTGTLTITIRCVVHGRYV
jgi:hypothetical protein